MFLSQLLPSLLGQREALDRLFGARLAACAVALDVPVVQAGLAGRFVTQVPHPRLSLLAAAWRRPRYWPLVRPAPKASLRATFYGDSAIYDAQGVTLGRVDGDEGLALADVALGAGDRQPGPAPGMSLPLEVGVLDTTLRAIAKWGPGG